VFPLGTTVAPVYVYPAKLCVPDTVKRVFVHAVAGGLEETTEVTDPPCPKECIENRKAKTINVDFICIDFIARIINFVQFTKSS